jgi:glucose/arabinose dehydrogenase
LVVLGALAVAPGAAEDERARSAAVRLVQVGSFDNPTYVAAPRGESDRLFVTEQAGVIRIMRDGRTLGRPFLDIRADVSCCGERGLFSMAFAPDFERSRRFYVYFTDNQGDIVVRGYRSSASDADVAIGGRRVIQIPHRRFSNHNGGQLQFGPDGLLYMGTGDGGGGGDPLRNAQDRGSLLGKLLRIEPRGSGRRYRTPRSNPFRGRRSGRAEIYAYGLRNPYRFSFDRNTGDLTIGDVGQNAVEEVDFRRRGRARGANFGWNRFEGRRRFSPGRAPGHVPPVLQRFRSQGACTVIGGYVVRDRALDDLFGRYVYGDLCDSALRSARLRPGRARGDRRVGVRVSQLVSFGEDGTGRVYAVSLRGPVYRLAAG